MALWMAYALLLSLLLAAAARIGEEGLDLYERPLRWVWIVAMAGAVVGPVVAYALAAAGPVGGGSGLAAGAASVGAGAGTGGALAVPLAAEVVGGAGTGLAGRLRFLDPWLLGGWAAASVATAGWLLAGWARLRVRRREWTEAEIDGVEVLISPDEGPAITGFLQGMILLPSWFDELDRDLRPLVLRHEREHLAVGDHRLLLGALVAVTLFPWNPVLWWSLARLRQAMEIDCDRRVLGEGVSRAAYGELLVQVGERASGPPLSPAAFADSSSFLERRIRRLAARSPRARLGKAAAAVAGAVVLVGAGGWLPAPDDPVDVAEARAAALTEDAAEARSHRAARVAPPAPAVMRLDLRLYRTPERPGTGQADGRTGEGSGLAMKAVRMARRLSYDCAPYLNGTADAGAGRRGERTRGDGSRSGCFVVVDGEPAHPSVLRELGSSSVASIRILPSDQAVDRFGPDASRGAYLVRTERG